MAAGAIGFGLFTAIFGLVNPAQEPHAFHNTIVAALLIAVSAPPVVAIARDPATAAGPLVVLTAVGVAALATMAMALTLDPFTLPFVVLVGVLWALARPDMAGVRSAGMNLPLIGVSVVAAIAFGPYLLEQAGLQRTDTTTEHDAFFHWVEMSFYAAAIPLVGLAAGFRLPGARLAGPIAGVASVILGAGSLALAQYPSALPGVPAWIAIGVGGAFLGLTALESRPARSP
jgi:hypothetical protein